MTVYDAQFYNHIAPGSMRSASVVLPLAAEVAQFGSCIDVGCGTAGWLSVALKCGATQVKGVDGDYVDRSALQIDPTDFVAHQLESPLPPLGRFDLVMSLEVAEHLSAARAASFVAELCDLGDCVLFSAAVPGQGGNEHINERWQSYWVAQFEANGFQAFDVIRPWIWADDRVEWWYRQNAFIAVKASRDDLVARALSRAAVAPVRWDTPTPDLMLQQVAKARKPPGTVEAAISLAKAVTRPVRRRIGRWQKR